MSAIIARPRRDRHRGLLTFRYLLIITFPWRVFDEHVIIGDPDMRVIFLDSFEYRCRLGKWYKNEQMLGLWVRSAAHIDRSRQIGESL